MFMIRAIWQTRSSLIYNSFQAGKLDKRASGGNAYDFHAMQALSHAFELTLDRVTVRKETENVFRYWYRLRGHQAVADIVIKDPNPIALGKMGSATVEVGMIHHIDYELKQSSPKHRWFFARLLKRMPRMNAVVTVSQYWKNKLEKLGCKRVEVIYNSFDLSEFTFDDREVEQFLMKHSIPLHRPLIYIGTASEQKGVVEVYRTLKDEGYTLVMTGPKKNVDIPVRWFNLERRDYLCLLRACDVVITMSRLLEGWNRVAHEAMLCRTPVIGSGTGGMRELLERGRQIILTDVAELPAAVRTALAYKEQQGQRGYEYVKQFNTDYFTNAWTSFAQGLLRDGAVANRD